MIIQIITFKSGLEEKDVIDTAQARADDFRALPGLIQKYYFKTGNDGEYGGLYIWQDQESMAAYRTSELATSIPAAYEILEKPNIQILNTLFTLRD